jgi:hypothetical protein
MHKQMQEAVILLKMNDHSLIEKIKNIHRDFQLAGAPSNTLLNSSKDLLSYILSLLKNELPILPNLSLDQWGKLVPLLKSHYISPLLYHRVSVLPYELQPPNEVVNQLRIAFLNNRVQGLKIEKQIGEISDTFSKRGIRVLFLKGSATAWSVYPDPVLRSFADFDILVVPENVNSARGILESLGYKCRAKIFEILEESHCEELFAYDNIKEDRLRIELHWGLHCFSWIKSAVSVRDLFSRSVKSKGPSFSMETLDLVDSLIYSALHMFLNHTHDIRLNWIYDIALIAKQLKVPGDWQMLQERSVSWNVRYAVELALKMAELWTDFKIPDGFSNFSLWPEPNKVERVNWHNVKSKDKSWINMLKLRMPQNLNYYEKVRFVYRILFPPASYIRNNFAARFLPFSYVKRWLKWGSRI